MANFKMRGDRRIASLAEWLFWTILVAILWSQTARFSQPMAGFRFGADGWPKVVLLCLWLGATFQLALSLWSEGRGTQEEQSKQKGKKKDKAKSGVMGRAWLYQLVLSRQSWRIASIFLVPLLYLWLMRRAGFFVVTPFFVMLYLWVLEVRSWNHLIAVSFSVYFLVLLVFTRLFYVALPVGSWLWFYELNNYIITLVRLGL